MQRDWRIRVSVFGHCHVLYFLRFIVFKFGFFQPVHVNNFRIFRIFAGKTAYFSDKLGLSANYDLARLMNLPAKREERENSNVVDNVCRKGTETRGWACAADANTHRCSVSWIKCNAAAAVLLLLACAYGWAAGVRLP